MPSSSQQKHHYDQKTSLLSVDYKQSNKFYTEHLHQVAQLITAFTKPSDKILEVGCGEALDSNLIDRKNLYVSDISLKRCASKHPQFILDLSKKSHIQKVFKKHGKFDVIFEVSTLHHVPDMDQALEHLKRLGHTIILIEPIIWSPQILFLSLLNIKNEPHYFKMKKQQVLSMLNNHFDEISHFPLYGRYHYLFAPIPNSLYPLFRPLYSLTTAPKYNVFVCR